MSVHYKFKSALDYDTITFDGIHISVKELKGAISQQKRIGKNSDFDLQVTNAQTKQVYEDEMTLIPKNTSLLIARIPLPAPSKSKAWEGYGGEAMKAARTDDNSLASKAVDLAALNVPETDKIMAMMSQSTQDYDPSNYMKIRGATQVGQVPANYRCYKCHQPGHWIKDCPLSQASETIDIKKSTGIPRSFMVEVEGPQVQGAMMTPYGSYAVPALDHQAYTQKSQPAALPQPKADIPDDLVCSICSDLLSDAVMIPCCGNSFCDECIRSTLLESEEHECPDCHDRDISPGTLIPNRYLRNAVANFKSTTGYVKRQVYKPSVNGPATEPLPPPANQQSPPPIETSEETKQASSDMKSTDEPTVDAEKSIITEGDSTETSKTVSTAVVSSSPEVAESPPVLPPGVSPTCERNAADVNATARPQPSRQQRSEVATRRPVNQQTEDRPDTPTVDEPAPMTAPPPSGILPTPTNIAPQTNGEFRSGGGGGGGGAIPNYLAGPPPPIVGTLPIHHLQPPPPIHVPQVYNQPPPHGHYAHAPPSHGGLLPPPQMPNYRIPPPPRHNYVQRLFGMPPPNRSNDPMYNDRQAMQSMPNSTNYGNYCSNEPRFRNDTICDYPPQNAPVITGIIDDPLEAFNRMLAEKDERERRAKAIRKGRSYSRSSSRSYSRSPIRRRSPRRRSRSRSKSYTSRSRSRSYSPGHRESSSYREFSPRRKRHAAQTPRYRASPQRSPTRYRYKNGEQRCREFERIREQPKQQRDFQPRSAHLVGGGSSSGNDFHYYENYARDNGIRSKWPTPGLLPIPGTVPLRNNYYAAQPMAQHSHLGHYQHEGHMPTIANRCMHITTHSYRPLSISKFPSFYHQSGGGSPITTKYPARGDCPTNAHNNYQPNVGPPVQADVMGTGPPQRGGGSRRVDDVLPPGVDQPLPPGEEPLRYNCSGYKYAPDEWNRDAERERERTRERDRDRDRDREERRSPEKERAFNGEEEISADVRPPSAGEKERDRDKPSKRERRSNASGDRSKGDTRTERASKDGEHRRKRSHSKSPTKRKSKKDESSPTANKRDREDKDRERRKDKDKDNDKHKDKERGVSDEERKKPKEKKRKRERKDSEKKRKRKERKEKKDKERDKEKERAAEAEKAETVTQEDEQPPPTNDETSVQNSIEEQLPVSPPVKDDANEDTKDDPIFEKKAIEQPDAELTFLPPADDKEIVSDDPPDTILDDPIIDECSYDGLTEENKDVNANPYPMDRKTSISPVDINPPKVDSPEVQHDTMDDEKNDKDDVLELYAQGQNELDKEMLASMPELSRWEKDEESNPGALVNDLDAKFDKTKVTQDVLKRAENAIFAKAINAIRPIEIKRISSDRFKLYSGEMAEKDAEEIKLPLLADESKEDGIKVRNKITFNDPTAPNPPTRISVKERLGCKVDDLDRIVLIDKPYDRQRSLSPFAKKTHELRIMRVQIDEKERERERYDRRKDRKYRSRDRDSRDRSLKDKEREGDNGKFRDSVRNRYRNQTRRQIVNGKLKELSAKDHLYLRPEKSKEKNDPMKDRDKGRDRNREVKDRNQSMSSRKRRNSRSNDKRKRSSSINASRHNKRDKLRNRDKKPRKEKDDKAAEQNGGKEKKTVVSSSRDIPEGDGDGWKKGIERSSSRATGKQSPSHSKIPKPTDSFNPKPSTTTTAESFAVPEGSASLLDSVPHLASSANPIKLSNDHRKITLDEANFEPDYDAESEIDDDRRKAEVSASATLKSHAPEKPDSSSASSSHSSSDESLRKRKKHKKHSKRKKGRRDSSSSSSNSDSSSSGDDKARKRKKHKKRSKKKKKSKHKS